MEKKKAMKVARSIDATIKVAAIGVIIVGVIIIARALIVPIGESIVAAIMAAGAIVLVYIKYTRNWKTPLYTLFFPQVYL